MTRVAQKTIEQDAIANFLDHWSEGADWRLVDEEHGAESPDALLARPDGSEVVGLEMTRYVCEPLARADATASALARDIENLLRADGVAGLGVFLSFYEASALAIGVGRERAANVRHMADFIRARLPVEESTVVSVRELERAGVLAVHGMVIFPAGDLFVVKAGGTGHGMGVQVLQPTIDAKAAKLWEYQTNARARAMRHVPDARFAGMWLIVTLFEGRGISSSILSRDAAGSLRRRDFERAFVLDFWEGSARRVAEICSRSCT